MNSRSPDDHIAEKTLKRGSFEGERPRHPGPKRPDAAERLRENRPREMT